MRRRSVLTILSAALAALVLPRRARAAWLESSTPTGGRHPGWFPVRRPPPPPPPNPEAGAEARLAKRARDAGVRFPLRNTRLVVHKADRTAELFEGETRVARYNVGLSRFSTTGAKLREGDGRTPEGSYFLCTKNEYSAWHLFLGISYPNAADARAALDAGIIGEREARAIADAETARVQPPWDTAMGGIVGLHGGGSNRDWTAGCVALRNDDLDEIWVACPVGTPIEIRA